ncbi:hypothetical protein [Fusobacterium sp.]|uniref:hypothetical protein n=1 Tax=Fusobacterium sp. TaxID=68766 RepID=UPI0029001DA2|nr:hypothetical protein [Fusobacterium sp.]MDU1912042.1 hypothetical protein [Fusobacterium sp.]
MGWFSSKKCETNIYVISENVNEKVKFNFIFYSLDEDTKNDYEFLKKVRNNIGNLTEKLKTPQWEKFSSMLWYNYGKSNGPLGSVNCVAELPADVSEGKILYAAIVNLNKKIVIPENHILPVTIKNYDNIKKASIVF